MTSSLYPKCTYRVSLKAISTFDNKLVLVKEESDYWDLPGGGIEHMEEVEPAFHREVMEELGVEVESFDQENPLVLFMFDHDPQRPLLFVAYRTKLKVRPPESIGNIEIGFFDESELTKIGMEKHLLRHIPAISKAAFEK